jgi:hypothetical protein
MNDALIERDAAFLAAHKIYVAPEGMVGSPQLLFGGPPFPSCQG